jgi:transposase
MLTLPSSVRIFIYSQATDMRCGFDRLSMFAETVMGQDVLSGHLFVFFNRFGDRCKVLAWDGTGLCIWYKRLEKGTFQSPRHCSNGAPSPVLEVDRGKLMCMLEGIDLAHAKKRKRYTRRTLPKPL